MANKPKPKPESSRRETVEAMRRAQQRKERRKTFLFVGIATVLGLGLVAAAAVPAIMEARNDPKKKAYSTFGVAAAQAGCGEVIDDKTAGENDHASPPEQIKYDTAPPTSGRHYGAPALGTPRFIARGEAPPVEQLVHNLEHGYTILWYDESVKGTQLEALRGLAERAAADDKLTQNRFLVVPWDETRGKFPEGKNIALSHWAKESGHRQYCSQVSGEAVQDFIEKFPWSNAPEAGAA